MKSKILTVLSVITAVVFVFALFMVIKNAKEYEEIDKNYTELQNNYVTEKEQKPIDNLETDDEISDEPSVPISVDFVSLKEEGKDVVGWLYLPDTIINYPVVQGKDNDFYLRKSIQKKYLRGGSLFADYRMKPVFEERNFIIYGHHMRNGGMLASLVEYKKPEFYYDHPIMYYLTPEQNYVVEIFAAYIAQRNDDIYDITASDEKYTNAIAHAIEQTPFETDVELKMDDPIICLSTCTYEFENARYIVLGKLVKV